MIRTVVWDVDDVLNDLTRAWLDQSWRPAHPTNAVRFSDLLENPPHVILGMTSSEYLDSLDSFRVSDGYARQDPNRPILDWMSSHGTESRHVALTATALEAAPATAAWVFTHFGSWIREFAVIPALRPRKEVPMYDADKGAWLARYGGRAVLVDDSARNLAGAASAGADTVCWPRPWNESQLTVRETLDELTQILGGTGT